MHNNLIPQLLDDLIPLIQRFPELPVSNASYNRNFVELLFNLYQVEQRALGHLKDLRPAQTLRTAIRYQEHGDAVCDSARLNPLKRLLQDDYHALSQFLGGRFQGVESDLSRLKNSQDFQGLAKKLIRLSPLLYSAAGDALAVAYIDQTRFPHAEDLQSYYYDTFKVHLSELFIRLSARQGYGDLQRFVGNVINQFIPRQVIPATTRYTSDNLPISEREIFLEEVPALYSSLRGAVAHDCSMVTVPYFGILQHTRVFWVMRSTAPHTRPDGYVFVAEVMLEDELVPYVITINGRNIDTTDCRAICYLLRSLYTCRTLLIADVSKVPYLVNSKRIEDAMAALSGVQRSVEMPQGWQAISQWSVNTVAYQNYYEQSRLNRPRVVTDEKLALFNARIGDVIVDDFYPKSPVNEVSLLNRSIMAYFFLCSADIGVTEEQLMPLLRLEKVHLQHSDKVIDLYQGRQFRVENFRILKDHFGFTLEDYAQLPFSLRVSSLSDLYHEFADDPAIPEQQWRTVCRKTFDELRQIAEQGFEREDRDTILQQMASIPDAFINEYWEVISRYFMIAENRLDYFMLRLMVKYFHSPHTVTRFLEFLDQHPAATEAVKPEDPRWFDYLMRVKTVAAQHAAFARLLQTLFHDQALDTELSMSAYEVDKRYQAALQLGWPVSQSLIKTVYQKRGWQ